MNRAFPYIYGFPTLRLLGCGRLGGGITQLSEMIGRTKELETARGLLLSERSEPRALLIDGEPGIGKTSLVEAAIGIVQEAGMQVWTSRPVEAEERLSYSGLADLLKAVPTEDFTALPDPQRRALLIALRRREPELTAPDPLTVSLALLSLVRRMTSRGPLVIVVDDIQWLDPATERALSYVARRAEGPLRLVLSARSEHVPPLFDEIKGSLKGVVSLTVAPLSSAALHHIFKAQLGESFPRPLLVRIEQACAGNPFYALEIGRAIASGRIEPMPGAPLVVPDGLASLITERLALLDQGTRDMLLYVAAAGEIRTNDLEKLLGGDQTVRIDQAKKAAVVEVLEGGLRFSHPLLTSSVYGSSPREGRERVHAELATISDDIERKAVHLALSGAGASPAVQQSLEEAAAGAQSRGAPEVAVDLLQLACSITDDPPPSTRRALADATMRAGDAAGAQQMIAELINSMPAGPDRAKVLQLGAIVAYETSGIEQSLAYSQQGLAEAGDDKALQVDLYWTLAAASYHDIDAGVEYSEKAMALIDEIDDPDVDSLCMVLMNAVGTTLMAGHPLDSASAERALALEERCSLRATDRPSASYGALLKYADDYPRARELLERTRKSIEEEGDEGGLPYVLSHFPQLELWSGRLEAARAAALEHLTYAESTGQEAQRVQALFNLSLAQSHLGDTDEAFESASECLILTERRGDPYFIGLALWGVGASRVHAGDPASAVITLDRVAEIRERIGVRDPGRWRFYPDHVEALLATEQVEKAEEQANLLLERGLASQRVSSVATGYRSLALVAAAKRDLSEADAQITRALESHNSWGSPFERARTMLVAGQIARRIRAKARARQLLEDARDTFGSVGARLWAARSAAELERLGARPGAPLELTETERRVAELAATGLTNRAVAAELFISPKTVEANLAKVYRKLEISTRAQLGSRLGRGA